jgi:hypothetical protein
MVEEHITMHDEIMTQKWVIQGPLLELCVLSLVTKPREWDFKSIEENISQSQVLENRYQFLKNIISKMKELSSIIEIIEDHERIYNEIKLLNEDKLVNIGYKRKGRMMLKIINEDIIKITVMYVDDDYRFKSTKELKKVLNKMVKLFNGICGSISHENTLSSIIKIDQLLHDNNIYGFYDIKWNYRVKRRI